MVGGNKPIVEPAALARFIAGYMDHHDGVAPTYAECARGIGVQSKASVSRLVRDLANSGSLRTLPRKDRAMELTRPVSIPRAPDGAPLYFVPIGNPRPIGSQGREDCTTQRPAHIASVSTPEHAREIASA